MATAACVMYQIDTCAWTPKKVQSLSTVALLPPPPPLHHVMSPKSSPKVEFFRRNCPLVDRGYRSPPGCSIHHTQQGSAGRLCQSITLSREAQYLHLFFMKIHNRYLCVDAKESTVAQYSRSAPASPPSIMPCPQNLPLGYLATELSSGG